LQELRSAIRQREVVSIDYKREDGEPSSRTVWPLGLFFWGHTWTLVGWCTLRDDFRHFRVDRIAHLERPGASYPVTPGRRLDDYFDLLEQRENITVPRD
jgi:predicted DNA-binding transcriptional regulator YafY